MKKPSSKIREEIARLQDALKHAETREAERIGRVALKALVVRLICKTIAQYISAHRVQAISHRPKISPPTIRSSRTRSCAFRPNV